jgi:uncharacterized protein YndB with AHSA1/START domain
MTIASATPESGYPLARCVHPAGVARVARGWMPKASMHFDVPPERAWEVLSEPRRYGAWVAGARAVHDADPRWPERGAVFRHSQGVPPLVISDTTTVVAAEAPRRLELEARVRPLLVARIVITIEPEPGGCEVTLDEQPVGGLLELPLKLPAAHVLALLRNHESLRRLRADAESYG